MFSNKKKQTSTDTRSPKHTITSLKAAKDRQRVHIYIDNQYYCTLDLDTLYRHHLTKGQQLDNQQLEQLTKTAEFNNNYLKALRYISLRPRSTYELKQWTKRKKLSPKLAEKIIKQLQGKKHLDDQKFANWWINQRLTYKPRGKNLLYLELKQKHIPTEIIKSELNKISKQTDNIQALIEKKLKTVTKLPLLEQKHKTIQYLIRKGFKYSEIKSTIDEYFKKT